MPSRSENKSDQVPAVKPVPPAPDNAVVYRLLAISFTAVNGFLLISNCLSRSLVFKDVLTRHHWLNWLLVSMPAVGLAGMLMVNAILFRRVSRGGPPPTKDQRRSLDWIFGGSLVAMIYLVFAFTAAHLLRR